MRSKKSLPAVAPTGIDLNQRWFDVALAAIYLLVSPQTVRGLIHSGKIPAAKFGGGYRIDRADLDRCLERKKRIVPPYRTGSHPWVADRWAKQRKQSTR